MAPPARPPTMRWYRQLSRKDWKAFFAAWLGYAMDGFDFVLITLVLTQIGREFDLDTVTLATLVSAAFISRWFGGLALGAIGDRYGRRPAMVLSIVLYSVGTFACGLAVGYWSLFAARLVVGLGMAGEYSASATYVIESWPRALRNRASGFLISGFSLGGVLAAQAYAVVVPTLGWRALFFVGIVPIVVALWLRRGIPETPDWQHQASAEHEASGGREASFIEVLYTGRAAPFNVLASIAVFGALFGIFALGASGWTVWLLIAVSAGGLIAFAAQFARSRTPMMITLMVVVFCAFLYSWPIQALLPTYLETELGYTPGQISGVLAFSGLGTMVGCWMGGFLGDWLGTRYAYVISLGISLVFVLPVFAMGGDLLLLLGVLLFCQQAFGQGISGLLPKLIGGYFDTSQRAAGLGFTYNVGALGGAAAPVIGAQIAAGTSLATALGGLAFGLTLVVIVLIAVDAPARVQRLFTPDVDVMIDRTTDADQVAPELRTAGAPPNDPTASTPPEGTDPTTP